jgi:hypothetical protein
MLLIKSSLFGKGKMGILGKYEKAFKYSVDDSNIPHEKIQVQDLQAQCSGGRSMGHQLLELLWCFVAFLQDPKSATPPWFAH